MTSSNGAGPERRRLGRGLSRRARLAIGGLAAVVIALVLVAPLVLLAGGSDHASRCRARILYHRHSYLGRPSERVVEAIAIGVGVASGCGAKPENVDLRSVAGIKPALAVALPADPRTVYVRVGVCPQAKNVIRCLRSRGEVVATGSLPQ